MADLRARQKALGRRAIVEACADLVAERRHLDFSVKEVAERAGVSLRTVYNHFAAREDLLDALGEVMDQRSQALGGVEARDVETRDDLLAAVKLNMAVFDQVGGIGDAIAQMPLENVGRDADRAERTKLITDVLIGQMPSVPPEDARAIAIVLRHLSSHRTWFWLTREYGLGTADVIRVVSWTIETLLDAAESGDLPEPGERK